jgi:hypothetical protein
MKRPSRKSARAAATAEARLWTQTQARAAVPYLGSVLRSLREHALDIQARQRRLARLENLPGRPNRGRLITIDDTKQELERHRLQLAETARELEALGASLLDPIQGLALLPFAHEQHLAWFIFDLFDANPLRWWRYQDDPEDFRRPITAAQSGVTSGDS